MKYNQENTVNLYIELLNRNNISIKIRNYYKTEDDISIYNINFLDFNGVLIENIKIEKFSFDSLIKVLEIFIKEQFKTDQKVYHEYINISICHLNYLTRKTRQKDLKKSEKKLKKTCVDNNLDFNTVKFNC